MKRRNALKGILGVSGMTMVAGYGYNYTKVPTGIQQKNIDDYSELLAALVDVIIPPTDTPGAQEAKAHLYVMAYLKECAGDKEYRNFYYGLKEIEENSVNSVGISFKNCSDKQKAQLLMQFEEEFPKNAMVSKIKNKLRGEAFFPLLRRLTVEGYCMSEAGATNHLAYQPIPAHYIAITELQPNQSCWATK